MAPEPLGKSRKTPFEALFSLSDDNVAQSPGIYAAGSCLRV
jgi:hypothetical protein